MNSSITVSSLAQASLLFVAFVGGLALLRTILPGTIHQGQKLRDGTRKSYKLNGLLLMGVLAAVLAIGQYTGLFTLGAVNRLFWPLFVICNVFAVIHSVYLYVSGVGKEPPHDQSQSVSVSASGEATATANMSLIGMLKDFTLGVELNPAIGNLDLKMFAYVPSLLGLWVMNLSFAGAQFEALGHLTTRMWVYQAFFTIYIINYFQFEYGMLHTWDVIAENLGFMLVWGDYVLVPFFYCIVGWHLVAYQAPIEIWQIVGLCVLFGVGFTLFRGSNQQKHDYKENPNVHIWGKPAETIGGRLLISGFWGIGRKINYTGELMVYTSWALLTGAQAFVPYILPFWLLCLFTHRAWRDEQRCSEKYGDLWKQYCAKARFRMIPFLY